MKSQYASFLKTLGRLSNPESPTSKLDHETDAVQAPLASLKFKLSPIKKKDNFNIMKVDKDGVIGLSLITKDNAECVWSFSLKCTSLQGGNLLQIPLSEFKQIIM